MSERHTIERDLGVIRGAKFYREGGKAMFVFGLDPNNVIGPREATNADKAAHRGEWEAFAREQVGVTIDADFDGHDDKTGQFVSPQPPRNKGGRPKRVKPDG